MNHIHKAPNAPRKFYIGDKARFQERCGLVCGLDATGVWVIFPDVPKARWFAADDLRFPLNQQSESLI